MKKLLIIAVLLSVTILCSDSWMDRFDIQNCTIEGSDVVHSLSCFTIGITAGQLTQNYYIGFGVPMLAGLGKELYDYSQTKKWNNEDMLFNLGGSAISFAINYIIIEKRRDKIERESVIGLKKLMRKRAGRMKNLGNKTFNRTDIELGWDK